MGMNVLVTGGAGFIGSHLCRELLDAGHQVTVIDNLDPQVHGQSLSSRRSPDVNYIQADILNKDALTKALTGIDAVAHLAATVGVGQSMYEVTYYTNTNVNGTGLLYEIIIKNNLPIKKIVVASSMSAYGEGLYACPKCRYISRGRQRSLEDLKRGFWELKCPKCGAILEPRPVPETEPFHCESIYALSKRDTEEIALMLGKAHQLPSIALRFFNVFGPGQSVSNPYTGVAAIFISRILNGKAPVIYEDGRQSRDFIHVRDVARAVRMSLESGIANEVFNVGTGRSITVDDVAQWALKASGELGRIKPEAGLGYRSGDIRHCFADTSKIRKQLRWEPKVSLEEGFTELVQWAKGVGAVDRFDQATSELERYGLLRPVR
ncbi:MAG: GDP-mannose 4,6-dehydratase [Elusimicrobia bacterium]|nr:GDP-mannose 4,6-dehydratase [Elusimicrobiota bacterium]